MSARGLVIVGLLVAPASALAEEARLEGVSLDWQAPPSCPDGAAVLDRVRSLVVPAASAEQVAARGVVTEPSTGEPWQLTLETVQGARTWQRSLQAGTCEALADAGALIIALILDPSLKSDEERAPLGKALDQPPPSPAREVPAPPPSPVTAPPHARRTAAAAPLAAPEASQRPATAPPPRRGDFGLHLAASALGDWGSLPRVAAGAEIAAGLGFDPIELELSGLILPEVREVIAPGKGGRITLAAAALRGCYVLDAGRLSGRICTGFEAGRLRGTGFGGTRFNDSRSALWLAPGLGVFGRFSLVEPVALRFGVEGRLPLTRPEFELENVDPVHRPSAALLRSQLGLEVLFR